MGSATGIVLMLAVIVFLVSRVVIRLVGCSGQSLPVRSRVDAGLRGGSRVL
jgi:hypothetical protein